MANLPFDPRPPLPRPGWLDNPHLGTGLVLVLLAALLVLWLLGTGALLATPETLLTL